MAAYIIAQIDLTDPEAYKGYASQTPAIAEQFGGTFLAKGGAAEQLEGKGRSRNVIIQFPDVESAKQFYNSPEYQAVLPIALENSEREMVLVEGV
jgi:uncharacterized protein (DUF1330 family)